MLHLTNTSMNSNKKFDELMEMFKKNMKGKTHETMEEGSLSQIYKSTAPKNTGYPPGFHPSTPTHFATYNDAQQWEEYGFNKSNGHTTVMGAPKMMEGFSTNQHVASLRNPNHKVRPPPSQNPTVSFVQSNVSSAPQPQQHISPLL